jgi:hypothetical protein
MIPGPKDTLELAMLENIKLRISTCLNDLILHPALRDLPGIQ